MGTYFSIPYVPKKAAVVEVSAVKTESVASQTPALVAADLKTEAEPKIRIPLTDMEAAITKEVDQILDQKREPDENKKAIQGLLVMVEDMQKIIEPKKEEEKKVEPKAEVKEEPKAEVKEEPKAEVKEEPKAEVKAEVKEEKKEEPKVEKKEEPKAEVKEEPKAEVKAEVKEEKKEEPKVEKKEEKKEEPKAEVKEEPKAEVKEEKKEEPKVEKKEEKKEEPTVEVKEEKKEEPKAEVKEEKKEESKDEKKPEYKEALKDLLRDAQIPKEPALPVIMEEPIMERKLSITIPSSSPIDPPRIPEMNKKKKNKK